MTSNSSVISLSNRALLAIGARAQISSLNEGTAEANAISTLFVPTYEQLARAAPWNCFRQQSVLSLLAAAAGAPENPDGTTLPIPPQPWLYSYALPTSSLQIRFIMPTYVNPSTGQPLSPAYVSAGTQTSGVGQIPYAVAYSTDTNSNPLQVILCNQSQAQAVYTVNQPNPVIWDSMFEQAFVYALGAMLVAPLALDMQLMQLITKTADGMIAQARVRDGDEGVTSVNRNASWMQARVRGGGLWFDQGSWAGPYGSYTDMAWPGGY